MNAPDQARQYDRTTQSVGNIVAPRARTTCADRRPAAGDDRSTSWGSGGTRDPYTFMGRRLEHVDEPRAHSRCTFPADGPQPRPRGAARGGRRRRARTSVRVQKHLTSRAGKVAAGRPGAEHAVRHGPYAGGRRGGSPARGATASAAMRRRPRFARHARSASPYVEFERPAGARPRASRGFYREVFARPGPRPRTAGAAVVTVGPGAGILRFRRVGRAALPAYDGHHIADLHRRFLRAAHAWLARARPRSRATRPTRTSGASRRIADPAGPAAEALRARARGAQPAATRSFGRGRSSIATPRSPTGPTFPDTTAFAGRFELDDCDTA